MLPEWAGRYVGTPWRPPQWTCWQLVRTVYREQFGLALPAFTGIDVDDVRLIEATIHGQREWRCIVAGEAFRDGDRTHDVGDVAVINQMGHDSHVGVMLGSARFLHVQRDCNTIISDFMRAEWSSRLSGIHRHRRLH